MPASEHGREGIDGVLAGVNNPVSVGDELPSVHPSEEENGSDMDDPGFESDSEGETDGGNETYPQAEVRCTLHDHYQYCFMARQY